ncbi:glycosyl hydrolase family protein [Butyrivibrio sp. CB08]|uniref:carbohydrate binding domain-containing protein n=1 Tax=Butyrivibrio sp. CB08 TaxID=2364879 RepID=UPI000EA9555C|nr:carbohydrate binding domain-containing protein [Butyrivibrio sp. CB08]RKM57562.1 glycosyl hydrolase family protein [Butyrivibrio sp. CB08]
MKKFRLRSMGRRIGVAAVSSALMVTALPVTSFAAPDAGSDDQGDGYSLVWSEEFDNGYLDTSSWNVEQHEKGWVNAELQRYTSLDEGNIEVSNGTLKIKPHYSEADSEESSEEGIDVEEKETTVAVDFTYSGDEIDTTALQINFGLVGGYQETSTAANVVLKSVYFVDDTDPDDIVVLSDSFAEGEWNGGAGGNGAGNYYSVDGKGYAQITDPGTENWHFQVQKSGFTLLKGHHYSFEMVATSDVDRAVEVTAMNSANWDWIGGTQMVIEGSGVASSGSGSTGSGKSEITSGRITTQGKHDFTYGRFEARAKVPAGQGYLPAFWLMATDEGLYGQWPRCGEIDIMEVKGQDLATSYHTIHYGYGSDSHKENQGKNYFSEGDYADQFHDYVVEWDPGKITWFVDGNEVYSTNDWYTGTDDENQLTYPAPFDQDFYIILNLAVGGSWVGYPDDDTYAAMNDQAYEVDYVRVYQKSAEEYERLEAEAKKPEKEEVKFREADESGNYVINGDFAKDIHMDGAADADKDNWKLHLENDANTTTYSIGKDGITITPSAVGMQNHSVQLKQENIPMIMGYEYELSFEAKADEDRTIVIDVEGPDKSWKRYFQDTTVNVGTTKELYTYTFTMNEKSDANGSLEFNLGNQASTAPVTISNVRLTHKSGEEIVDDGAKVIRPDGNYVYNGGFDQGEKRLGYWEFDEANAQYISVTNTKNVRELKVVVPEGKTITVGQSELSPLAKGEYELSFKARTEDGAADGVSFEVAGTEYEPELEATGKSFSKKFYFDNDKDRAGSYVKMTFDKAGTYYVDDVFLCESALIKNGSFNAGIAGFSPYIYDTVKSSYVIDSMNGNDNAFAITIEDTMADDAGNSWYVQLNQDGVPLEQGKCYKLSFKAKSSIDRKISFCMQQFEGTWANYSKTGAVDIGENWKTFTATFKMEDPSDNAARFNITMGSVEGVRITTKHDVYIDDISLIEIDESQLVEGITETVDDPSQGNTDSDQPSDPGENPGEQPGDEPTEPGDEPGDQPGVEPGTGDPSIEPGNEPGSEPGNIDPQPEPEPEPEPQPEKPTYNPIIRVIVPVVKAVAKVVKTVVSILRRLFW